MEKVIVIKDVQYLNTTSEVDKEVNTYLANGWTVKSVTPVATKVCAIAIFVLKKD